jgi:hypothetical protein
VASLKGASPADRTERRIARRRFIEALRASPAPSAFRIALYGFGAGAGAAAVLGLLYLISFGAIGSVLSRWTGEPVLTGYPGPLFPLFIGTLFSNSVSTAVLSLPYHFLCRYFPRLAGLSGGIGFSLAVWLVLQPIGSVMRASAPLQISSDLRVFVLVGSLVSVCIAGAVIGQAELFERKLPVSI